MNKSKIWEVSEKRIEILQLEKYQGFLEKRMKLDAKNLKEIQQQLNVLKK